MSETLTPIDQQREAIWSLHYPILMNMMDRARVAEHGAIEGIDDKVHVRANQEDQNVSIVDLLDVIAEEQSKVAVLVFEQTESARPKLGSLVTGGSRYRPRRDDGPVTTAVPATPPTPAHGTALQPVS